MNDAILDSASSRVSRRRLLKVAGSLPLAWASTQIAAQASTQWPSQTIKVVCPYGAGSPVDTVGRFMVNCLQLGLDNNPIIVENIAGGGGTVGPANVLRAPADGNTLLIHNGFSLVTGQLLNSSAKYDARDFIPMWGLTSLGTVVIVSGQSQYKTMKELVDAARARPGQLNYGSAGVGSAPHVNTEMFMRATGIKMLHVPYRSSAAVINDMLSGQVDCLLASIASVVPLLADGRVRALAVLRDERVSVAPNVPTLKETGLSDWRPAPSLFTFFSSPKVPAEIRSRIAEASQRGFDNDPGARQQLSRLGLVGAMRGAELTKFIDSERESLVRAVKEAGITPT